MGVSGRPLRVTGRFLCPLCGMDFEDPLPAPGPPAGMESDTRPLFFGEDPLPFLVHTCPGCAYSAGEEGFCQPLPGRLRAWVLSGGLGRLQDPAPSRRFTLAARCKEKSGGTAEEVGDLYLAASWAARVEGDRAMARLSRARALHALTRVLAEGRLGPDSEARARYLAGELLRLQGEFSRAQVFLASVEHPAWASHAARALELARRGEEDLFRF